ncbi:MAG: helix-turn-helix transcriptional regulator [Campylobacterales bacterium]|nr:helix-turn-helix transcriptional regulator [Campylobacterales bacterium]
MSNFERFKEIKVHTKLNTKQLAARLELPYRTLVNYERGERKFSIEFVEALVTHLGINANWLLTGQGNMLSDSEQKKYSLVPVVIEINAIPRIASALKTKLDEVVELLSEDIYEQNLSLRELQIDDSSIPDIHIPYSDILDEILALYKQRKDGAGNPEFKSQNIAEKINTLKLDYQRSIKHEYKIGTLLRHWTSILEQEFKTSFE